MDEQGDYARWMMNSTWYDPLGDLVQQMESKPLHVALVIDELDDEVIDSISPSLSAGEY